MNGTTKRRPDAGAAVAEVAAALHVSVVLLVRRLRQSPAGDDLTLPETSALARLDRSGPTTAAGLARLEQISPQSMGATLAALEGRGLVARAPDPGDGRCVVVSLTPAGRATLRDRRDERTRQLATALERAFTAAERRQLLAAAPLLERLAHEL